MTEMRKFILLLSISFSLLLTNCNAGSSAKSTTKDSTKVTEKDVDKLSSEGEVVSLTNEMFKKKIFNYGVNKEWKFEGDMPVIIDFYATWCGPCKMLSPRVDAVAKQFAGKIRVYKVDTDEEELLAQTFGITSLPTLLFIPMEGQPQASSGLISKDELIKAINNVLQVK